MVAVLRYRKALYMYDPAFKAGTFVKGSRLAKLLGLRMAKLLWRTIGRFGRARQVRADYCYIAGRGTQEADCMRYAALWMLTIVSRLTELARTERALSGTEAGVGRAVTIITMLILTNLHRSHHHHHHCILPQPQHHPHVNIPHKRIISITDSCRPTHQSFTTHARDPFLLPRRPGFCAASIQD